jgi:tRNA1(Val) A37 N6-methylase TrmN6
MAEPEITEDALLNGRIRIRQPARGYRVNVDTLLLAATFDPAMSWGGCRFVEVGCGVGGALLAIAKNLEHLKPPIRLVGIERDPAFAALARANVISNGFAEIMEIVEGDALVPPASLGQFDRVLFNPPYDYPGDGRQPASERLHAHVADRPIGDWIKVWSNRMTGDGHLTLIQRAQRLSEILSALEGRLGGVEIFPIRPHADADARRIIVRARKGSKAPLKLRRGLDLHPALSGKDKYTPEAESTLRGERFIDLC